VSVVTRFRKSKVVRRFFHNKAAVIGFSFIVFLVLVALLTLVWTPQDPNAQNLLHRLKGPSTSNLLGTDAFGRDLLSRLMVATRVTLLAACQGIGIAVVLGIPAGLAAGYIGGAFDNVMSRIADALLTLPPLILALALVGMLGPSLSNAMIAIGIVIAPRFYRIARAAAGSIKHENYIEAVRAMGASMPKVLQRHVLPNASGPLLVQVSFAVGLVIVAEASLSFLGLGVRPPTASWGSMVRDGFNNVRITSFPIIPPAVMIVLTIMAFSMIGDGMRDALGRQSRVGA
jgi:peptide/nickel transport system permease protein